MSTCGTSAGNTRKPASRPAAETWPRRRIHVTAAKAILDKGTNPEQTQFFPYLRGYVAFYGQDYKAAAEELPKANQNDPFIQCLLGQTYEKLGEKDKALESYRKAAAATAHNPPAAYAVPFAKKKLASLAD